MKSRFRRILQPRFGHAERSQEAVVSPSRSPTRGVTPRLFVLALLLLGTVFLLVAPNRAQTPSGTDPSEAAFRRVSNRLLCQCGCNYMVLSCNHLDCSSATYIRKTIRTSLEAGKSEDTIVAGFVEQYGAKILPEPPKQGFSWMAWIMPFVALILGGGAVSYVLWLWKWKPAAAGAGGAADLDSAAIDIPPAKAVSPELVEKYRAAIDQELEKD